MIKNQKGYRIVSTSNNSAEIEKKKIDSKCKSIISTVMERCKKEKVLNRLVVPIEDYEERVSYYTGYPKTYIYELSDDENKYDRSIDPGRRLEIACALKNLYLKQEPNISYKTVYRELYYENSKDPRIPPLSKFRIDVAVLGYDCKKTSNGFLLLEDPKITFERFHYIKKIKNFRQKGKYIYYIDERILKSAGEFRKPNKKPYDGSNMLFFHMISKYGYENGLYCCNTTSDDYLKWITDIILPILKPSSVIVFDNSPVHENFQSESISRYHSKQDMLKWLRKNNIPCDDTMHKAELFELVDKCSSLTHQYHVEHILKANGHEVLILPTNYQDLSLTDLLWRDISLNMKLSPKVDLHQQKENINWYITSIVPNTWREYDKIIEAKEIQISAIDAAIETSLENYKLDVDNIVTGYPSGLNDFDYFDDE